MDKRLQLDQLDWNDIYDPENVITNHEPTDNKVNFNDDGVFSERIFGKMESDNIQYSCKCGSRVGKFYEGTECKECETIVKFTGPVVQRAGWIDFGGNYLIKPIMYNMIDKRIFPQGVLNEIIKYKATLNLKGEIIQDDEDIELFDKDDPRTKYFHIGMDEFRENFREILDYYHGISKLKDRDKAYKYVVDNIDHVFIDKMYVVTTVVRPALNIGGERLKYAEVNNHYNNIIKNMEALKQFTPAENIDMNRLPFLYSSQISANLAYKSLGDSIKGKSGFIRNNILGTRLDYSSRNVITPLPPGYNINECLLPYKTAIELLRPRIINILVRLKGINYIKANDIWRDALLEYNTEVYDIMMELVKKTDGGIKILLNRNPEHCGVVKLY